jgi:NAD-dependent dihydropyrimidine dehydrogenase PreA subunit
MMPIDKDFRQTWSITSRTKNYAIWTSDNQGEIHGTAVAVHLDSCIACMKCKEACPTSVFSTLSDGNHDAVVPTAEQDCIFCMVCEMVCPTEAISLDKHVGSDETLDSLLGNV